MVSGAEIVRIARGYKGTPFKHQGRLPGKKLDCAGVLICSGNAAGVTDVDISNYSSEPDPRTMKSILDRELIPIPISEAQIGDVFWLVCGGADPRHLAVFTGATIVHSYEGAGKCVEHRLDTKWRRRIRAAYRFPGVN